MSLRDELIAHLLTDIALSGSKGLTEQRFERLVKAFYHDKNSKLLNPNSTTVDILFSKSPPSAPIWVDAKLLDVTFEHLCKHPDAEVRPIRGKGIGDEDEQVPRSVASPALKAQFDGKRVFTTEERVWQAIAGHGVDHMRIPKFEFECLSVIAAYGPPGVLQPHVVHISGQDKRSVPKRTDALAEKGYIFKEAVIGAGTKTSLVKLKRYTSVQSLSQPTLPRMRAGLNPNNDYRPVISYDAWFDQVMAKLKEKKEILAVRDLLTHLGVEPTTWTSKIIFRCLRRLDASGCIRRLRARPLGRDPSAKDIKIRAIELLREPDDVDRSAFKANDVCGRGPDILAWNDDEDAYVTVEGVDSTEVEGDVVEVDEALSDHEEEVGAGVEDKEKPPSKPDQQERPLPQWSPDLPLNNLVYDIIHSSGVAGIGATDLVAKAVGSSWQVPLEEALHRLVGFSSQPAHLKHLAITRTLEPSLGKTAYLYRSIRNFEEAGRTSSSSKLTAKAYASSKTQLDEWGFPAVDSSQLAKINTKLSLDEDARSGSREDKAMPSVSQLIGKRKRADTIDDIGFETEREDINPDTSNITPSKRVTRGKRVRVDDLEAAAVLDSVDEDEGTVRSRRRSRREGVGFDRKRWRAESGSDTDEGETRSNRNSSKAAPASKSSADPATPRVKRRYARPAIPVVKKRKITEEEREEYERAAQATAERRVRAEIRLKKKQMAAAAGVPRPIGPAGEKPSSALDSNTLVPAGEDADDEELPEERVAQVKADILAQTKPGVYIDPPEAVKTKLENFIRRGRPRKSLIAVIKTPLLEGLPWFEDDSGPRYAPIRKRWDKKAAPALDADEDASATTSAPKQVEDMQPVQSSNIGDSLPRNDQLDRSASTAEEEPASLLGEQSATADVASQVERRAEKEVPSQPSTLSQMPSTGSLPQTEQTSIEPRADPTTFTQDDRAQATQMVAPIDQPSLVGMPVSKKEKSKFPKMPEAYGRMRLNSPKPRSSSPEDLITQSRNGVSSIQSSAPTNQQDQSVFTLPASSSITDPSTISKTVSEPIAQSPHYNPEHSGTFPGPTFPSFRPAPSGTVNGAPAPRPSLASPSADSSHGSHAPIAENGAEISRSSSPSSAQTLLAPLKSSVVSAKEELKALRSKRGRKTAATWERIAELEEIIASPYSGPITAPEPQKSLVVKIPMPSWGSQVATEASSTQVAGPTSLASSVAEPSIINASTEMQVAASAGTVRDSNETTDAGETSLAEVEPPATPSSAAQPLTNETPSNDLASPRVGNVDPKPNGAKSSKTLTFEYVQAHPDEDFHHRGGGYWTRGLPPVNSARKFRVHGPGGEAWLAQRAAATASGEATTKKKSATMLDKALATTAKKDSSNGRLSAPGAGTAAPENTSAPVTTDQATPLPLQNGVTTASLQQSNVINPPSSNLSSVQSPLAIVRPYSKHSTQAGTASHAQPFLRQVDAVSNPVLASQTPFAAQQNGSNSQRTPVIAKASPAPNGDPMDIDTTPSTSQVPDRPAPLARQAKAKPRTARANGSTADQRQKILLDAVRACGGCFPGNEEPWCVLATAWKESHGEDLDRESADIVVRNMVDNKKLKKITFQFKTSQGLLVKRLILLDKQVSSYAQGVTELRKKMISCFPAPYIPSEVEVSDEMRVKVGGEQKPLAQVTSNSRVWGRRTGSQATAGQDTSNGPLVDEFSDDDDDEVEIDNAQAAMQGQMQLSRYQHDPTALPPKSKRGQKLTQTIQLDGFPKKPTRLSASTQEISSYHVDGNRPGARGADSSLGGAIKPLAYSSALLLHPNQWFHETSGTFGTSGIVQIPSQAESRNLRTRAVRLDGIIHGYGTSTRQRALPQSDLSSPSMTSRLQQQRENAKLQQLRGAANADELAALERGDLRMRNRLANRSRQTNWLLEAQEETSGRRRTSKLDDDDSDEFMPSEEEEQDSHDSDEDFSEDEEVGTPKRGSAVVRLKVPNLGSLGTPRQTGPKNRFLPSSDTRRTQYKKRTKRTSTTAIDDFVVSDNDYLPGTGKVRATANREIAQRDRKSAAEFKDIHRLVTAIALVTLICGGVNQTVISWNIVAHALSFRWDGDFLRRRWSLLKKANIGTLDRFRDALREPFLTAYQNDDLPRINFHNLTATDWPSLFEWADQVRSSIKESNGSTATALTSRSELLDEFELEERNPVFELSRSDYFVVTTDLGRRHLALRYNHGNVLSGQVRPGEELQPDMVLRSWARAIALTKQWNYNSAEASKKLQNAFQPSDIERVNRAMADAHMLTRSHKSILPGRNFEISNDVLAQFRRWPAKPDEHTYLRHVAGAWTHIMQHLKDNDELRLIPAASDPEYVVLTNMISEGLLKPTVMLPERNNDFDAAPPKLSPWGYGGYSYETKRVNPSVLKFPIAYHKTERFSLNHGLNPHVPIPTEADMVEGEEGTRIPFWMDIHGNMLDDAWDMTIRSLLHLLVFRPGSTAMSMEKAHDRKLWAWEIEMALGWMEKVGIAAQNEAGGWRAGIRWYCAFLPEITKQWKAPQGAELVTYA